MIYKGLNIYPLANSTDVAAAVSTGANILRYQIMHGSGHLPFDGYNVWLDSYINHIRVNILPVIGAAKLLITLNTTPGGVTKRKLNAIRDSSRLLETQLAWRKLADAFKDEPKVLGYDIINEPAGKGREVRNIMIDLWGDIRTVAPTKLISVTHPFGQPGNFDEIVKLGDPNIWYQVHMYEPMKLTHQGLYGRKTGRRYPSLLLKRKQIERELRPVMRWQDKHKQQIFVGEFSISTFADAASRVAYITDLVSIFNSRGWHWAYHAFREADCWSPEATPGVLQALRNGWSI